jgi:hypothetical protein
MSPPSSSEHIQSFKNTPLYSYRQGELERILGLIDESKEIIPGVTDSYVESTKHFASNVYQAFEQGRNTDTLPWLGKHQDIESFKRSYIDAVIRTLRKYLRESKYKSGKLSIVGVSGLFRQKAPEFFLVFPIIAYSQSSEPLDDGCAVYKFKVVIPNGEQLPITPKAEERKYA